MKFRDIRESVLSSPENDPSLVKKSIRELGELFDELKNKHEETLRIQEKILKDINKLRATGLASDKTTFIMLDKVAGLSKELDKIEKTQEKIYKEMEMKFKGRMGEN